MTKDSIWKWLATHSEEALPAPLLVAFVLHAIDVYGVTKGNAAFWIEGFLDLTDLDGGYSGRQQLAKDFTSYVDRYSRAT